MDPHPPLIRYMLLLLFVFLLNTTQAHAYPQYALRYNQNRCTACHWSPAGGGPKNVNGKLFAARGYHINPLLVQDYVSADFRVLYYLPQRHTDAKGGAGVMSASVAGHVALDEEERTHLVIDHNFGGFQAGSANFRDTYALFRLAPNDGAPHAFDSLMVGRFRTPFGIATDEHRTYTRIASATEWFSFETGAMLSGTPTRNLHYDLAAVNGEKSPGSSIGNGQAERWGSVLNLRYMIGPVFVGASGSYHEHKERRESRSAGSLYSIISVSRMTDDRVPLSIRLEHVRAQNWGQRLGQGLISDQNYVSTLQRSQAHAWLGWLDWTFSERLSATYKFEWLTPDRDFPSDYYLRHGLGLEYRVAPATRVMVRHEFAKATHPSEFGSTAMGGEDATYGVLIISL